MAVANKVRNMHYDFKTRLNKVDSQKNRNLLVPEIDRRLNEAQLMFIKMIAQPRANMVFGFESSQRNMDDIRTVVEKSKVITTEKVSDKLYKVLFPEDYMYHVSSYANCVKTTDCSQMIRTVIRQHDDKNEESFFDSSSFEWREVNVNIAGNYMYVYTDGTFSVSGLSLDYIRRPRYIHTAVDFANGTYTLPDGTILTGFQNCELPDHVYDDIVDLAVLITTGDLLGDYQSKQSKIQMTN